MREQECRDEGREIFDEKVETGGLEERLEPAADLKGYAMDILMSLDV